MNYKLVLIIPFVLFHSISVRADLHENNCRNLMKYADQVMYERQTGTTLAELLNSIDKVKKDTKLTDEQNQIVKNAFAYIATEAFKEPLRKMKDEKVEIVREFSAKMYIECISIGENKTNLIE